MAISTYFIVFVGRPVGRRLWRWMLRSQTFSELSLEKCADRGVGFRLHEEKMRLLSTLGGTGRHAGRIQAGRFPDTIGEKSPFQGAISAEFRRLARLYRCRIAWDIPLPERRDNPAKRSASSLCGQPPARTGGRCRRFGMPVAVDSSSEHTLTDCRLAEAATDGSALAAWSSRRTKNNKETFMSGQTAQASRLHSGYWCRHFPSRPPQGCVLFCLPNAPSATGC